LSLALRDELQLNLRYESISNERLGCDRELQHPWKVWRNKVHDHRTLGTKMDSKDPLTIFPYTGSDYYSKHIC
jgi:hypothetical protein